MDSEELARSSNSPNANRYIHSITQGAVGTQIRIDLTDGSSFYTRPQFLLDYSPVEGDAVSEDFIELLTEETLLVAAIEKAVDYLARREHSRSELERKLRKKEFPPSAIRGALNICSEHGYLDDERFARLWTESRMRRKAEGPKMIAAKLMKKGVDQGIVERVVEEYFTEEAVAEALRRAVEKYGRREEDDPRKLTKYLLARGFTINQINAYLR